MLNACARVRIVAMLFASLGVIEARAHVFTPDDALDGADAQVGDGICATATGTCSLRAAIQEANARPGLDEIHLQPCLEGACTVYRIDIDATGNDEDVARSGDLDVRDALVVRRDPAYARGLVHVGGFTHAGTPDDRVFDIDVPPGAPATHFSNLLIANGHLADVDADGAGLRVSAGSVVALERIVLYANFGHGHGSALSTRGSVDLRDAFVFDNHQLRDGPVKTAGGTLHVGAGGRLALENAVVDSNSNWHGGAIHVVGSGARADVRRAHLRNSHDLAAAEGGHLAVENTTLAGGAPLTAFGGARIDLVHVTMAPVPKAPTPLLQADDSGAGISLANSAIEGAVGGVSACDAPTAALTSLGGNVFGTAPPCALVARPDDHVVASLRLVAVLYPPPLAVMPNSWHGAMAPTADSPLIDAASTALCLPEDQFGMPRPGPTPAARCDSGAIEWPLDRIHGDGFDGGFATLVEAVLQQRIAEQHDREQVVVGR